MKAFKILPVAALALLSFVASSCLYSDTEEYWVVPVADDPAVVRFLSSLDSLPSPVILTDSLVVFYEVEIENGDFYQARISVSDLEIYRSDSLAGTFVVDSSMLSPGGVAEMLDVLLFYSSNTNSLGDYYGIEASDSTLSFPITRPGMEETGI